MSDYTTEDYLDWQYREAIANGAKPCPSCEIRGECARCNGTTEIWFDDCYPDPCPSCLDGLCMECGGDGYVYEKERLAP